MEGLRSRCKHPSRFEGAGRQRQPMVQPALSRPFTGCETMNALRSYHRIIFVTALAACFAAPRVARAQDSFKFHFGNARAQRGWALVSATNIYSSGTGFGFE